MNQAKILRVSILLGLGLIIPTAGLRAEDTVLLKLKWAKGKTYHYSMVMNAKVNTAAPKESVTNMTMNMDVKSTVVGELPQGGYKFEGQISFGKMKMEMAGAATVTFDSDAATVSGMPNPFADFKGKTGRFQYSVDSQGKITDFKGLKEFLDSLGSKGKSGGQAAKNYLSEDSLKGMFPGSVDFLPSHPVKVGDSWPFKMNMDAQGMKLNLSSTYTFAGWEKKEGRDCVVLNNKGTMSMNTGDGLGMKGVKTEIKSSTIAGKVWFDPAEGQAIDTQANTHTVMSISISQPSSASGQSGASTSFSMTMTMSMDQDIDVKLDKID